MLQIKQLGSRIVDFDHIHIQDCLTKIENATNWFVVSNFAFRSQLEFNNTAHNKTLQRFIRGGLTLDIAFRPHLPLGKTTLHELQVGGARQPSLDVCHPYTRELKIWEVPAISQLPRTNNYQFLAPQCPLHSHNGTLEENEGAGEDIPGEFSRPEVVKILQEYYASLS